MAVKKKSNSVSVLFFLGMVLLSYGLGSSYIAGRIVPAAAALAILGVAALLICFARVRGLMPKGSSASRWKKYGLFFLVVVAWTVLFLEVNYLGYRFNKRWDLTKARQHTLSKNTTDIIGDLFNKIQLTVFYVGIPPKYLEDLLKEYERLSNGMITSEIIDPLVQIGYAAQFGNVISGKEQKVFVQSGREQRDVDFTGKILDEEQLTNAIIRVTRKVRSIYYLTGHNEYSIDEEGETGLKAFQTLLAANNVIGKRLLLGMDGKIPEDCDVLVVAGPRNDLSKYEEDLILDYLNRGGDALFLIEHVIITTPDNPLTEEARKKYPSLNNILNEWGLNVADDVVVDLSSHASGDVGSPATRNYLAHRSIVNDLDYTFFIRPRSISILSDRRPSIKLAPIILTASDEASWGETNRTLEIKFDPGVDRPGPVPIAFAIWESKDASIPVKTPETGVPTPSTEKSEGVTKGKSSDTRIVVITDADFLTNAYIGQYSNAHLGINVIHWLSEMDYQAFFEHKDIEISRLDLTSQQKRIVVVILVLMPVLIACGGTIVWMKRQIM